MPHHRRSQLHFPPPGSPFAGSRSPGDGPTSGQALLLSVEVALVATALALVLGTLAAAALFRFRFFGKERSRC